MRKSSIGFKLFCDPVKPRFGANEIWLPFSTKTQKFHISASLGQILATLVSILVVSGAISRLVINGSD